MSNAIIIILTACVVSLSVLTYMLYRGLQESDAVMAHLAHDQTLNRERLTRLAADVAEIYRLVHEIPTSLDWREPDVLPPSHTPVLVTHLRQDGGKLRLEVAEAIYLDTLERWALPRSGYAIHVIAWADMPRPYRGETHD